ncbi:ZZ-type zinc finger-containing protein 3 [Diabrotica virgifera virgifera]|uniref:ZZ-type zinc finger-containing protein 3 n=1 Tax=Diabrotica virgifera virgifera TaxID=50390 RepID=A0A6P7FJL7_DIAVI|nr:ZZ-type zinc finger-containing protein 3 [Diabrotica virgifera virgifera]
MASNINTNEEDCFFFESEHLALRGNKDYCDVLKTLYILVAQRERLIKDYNQVVEVKRRALEDTQSLFKKFVNKEDLGMQLPGRLELAKLPVIKFENYDVKLPKSEIDLIYSETTPAAPVEDEFKKVTDKSKSEGNNAWTSEEQKKLEELLQKYPPEAIENRRFKKIAKELGTRSLAQVASRIQKYFLKLYQAGLPIPGRLPKSVDKIKKSFLHKHQRHNYYLYKPSTFFPKFNPPVVMDEMEDIPGPSSSHHPAEEPATPSNYLMETEYLNADYMKGKTKAEVQIQLLKKVKEVKLQEMAYENCFQHIEFKCDYCSAEPIVGSRWSCLVCPKLTNFCTDCFVSQMYANNCHPLTHPMVIYRDSENYCLSHGDDISSMVNSKAKDVDSDNEDTTDSFESTNRAVKEENEEGLGTDEESRSNFDSDMN